MTAQAQPYPYGTGATPRVAGASPRPTEPPVPVPPGYPAGGGEPSYAAGPPPGYRPPVQQYGGVFKDLTQQATQTALPGYGSAAYMANKAEDRARLNQPVSRTVDYRNFKNDMEAKIQQTPAYLRDIKEREAKMTKVDCWNSPNPRKCAAVNAGLQQSALSKLSDRWNQEDGLAVKGLGHSQNLSSQVHNNANQIAMQQAIADTNAAAQMQAQGLQNEGYARQGDLAREQNAFTNMLALDKLALDRENSAVERDVQVGPEYAAWLAGGRQGEAPTMGGTAGYTAMLNERAADAAETQRRQEKVLGGIDKSARSEVENNNLMAITNAYEQLADENGNLSPENAAFLRQAANSTKYGIQPVAPGSGRLFSGRGIMPDQVFYRDPTLEAEDNQRNLGSKIGDNIYNFFTPGQTEQGFMRRVRAADGKIYLVPADQYDQIAMGTEDMLSPL